MIFSLYVMNIKPDGGKKAMKDKEQVKMVLIL